MKKVIALGAAAALTLALSADAFAGNGTPIDAASANVLTLAVYGDSPYGTTPTDTAQFDATPAFIDSINADPKVDLVMQVGDIHSGKQYCTQAYDQSIYDLWTRYRDPVVYTPGDNEWTDCHRANNGSYNPLERLAKIRDVFFPHPGYTLGQHSVRVNADTAAGYPEDVRYTRADVAFAGVHIVGSNNSLAPWTGNTAPTPEQTSEVLGRTAAVIQTIRETFSAAKTDHNKAVVLLTQADMFDPTVLNPSFADYYAFQPIVKAIAQESAAFHGPVYLFNGDSHVYNSDKPLGTGSNWLSFYGITTPADNLSRVTIDGSTAVNNYLRVTVDPHSAAVLSWEKVPFAS